MITKAFGNLPGEEQQEKAGHTAQWAKEPCRPSGGRTLQQMEIRYAYAQEFLWEVFAGSQATCVTGRSLNKKMLY